MTTDAWLTLGILIVMFALLVWDRLPAWLVFVGTMTVMMSLRLASVDELVKGFSNTGVLTVAALFPVAAGMYATGAITLVADWLIGLPRSLREAQTKILPPVAVGSAFLNNTPLVAMMIPVIRDISRASGLPGSKLYIPLSFASILGGAATLIGTSVNLIIAGLVVEEMANGAGASGMQELSIFTPTLVGLPAAALGIVFLILVSPYLLPAARKEDDESDLRRQYRTEFTVQDDSILEGKTLQEAGLYQAEGYHLVSMQKSTGDPVEIEPNVKIYGRDILAFSAEDEIVPELWAKMGLLPEISPVPMDSQRHRHRLVEVVISSRSPAVGRKISELPLPDSPYRIKMVGISRDGEAPDVPLSEVRMEIGDNAILEVNDDFFYENRRQVDFTLIKRLRGYRVQRAGRAMIALIITIGMILLAAFGLMSMLNAALLAGGAMLLTGCLTINRAWQSIEWKTLVVLGAAVGLEAAVSTSGLSDVIADLLFRVGGNQPMLALVAVFVGCIIMTNVITNAAAAAFMFPVAVALAISLDVNVMPFIVVLMLGTSYALINPAGYQTNLMVQGPGEYKFMDFVKVGLPLTVVVGAVVVFLTPVVFPF